MKWILKATVLSVFLLLILLGGSKMFLFLKNTDMPNGSIQIHRPIHMPFQIPQLKPKTLIFFGYVGCSDICTPRLHEIASIMKQYHHRYPRHDLDVLFINLNTVSTTADADAFAKSFHPDFIGITLPKHELMKMTSEFDAYYSSGLRNKNEINHSQHLYLVFKNSDQNSYLKNIYAKVPYDTKVILHDLLKEKDE